jgi:hypothetical protein
LFVLLTLSPNTQTHKQGLTGLAFRFYDSTVAVINAHFPATAAYPGPSPLRKRDQHVAAMLRALRIGGAEHEEWDAHLQFHHGMYVRTERGSGLGCLFDTCL